MPEEIKQYSIGQVKRIVEIIMTTFVYGEDNSWKCRHNLNVLLRGIDNVISLEKIGQKIDDYKTT